MKSLLHGRPKERLVVFRWGGNHNDPGLELGNNGDERQQIINIIGSIYAVCAEIAQCTMNKKLPTDNTQDRLDYLYHSNDSKRMKKNEVTVYSRRNLEVGEKYMSQLY